MAGMSTVNPESERSSWDDSDRLESIVTRFERAWRNGEQPAIEDFLHIDPAARPALLLELVHAELELLLKAGQDVRVEAYLQRFPELGAAREGVLRLIEAEYELRLRRDPGVRAEEFLERFPDLRSALLTRLQTQP